MLLMYPTVTDLFRPHQKALAWLYDAAVIVTASLLIAISAQIAIHRPIPITAQTFAVLLIAALLGAKRAALCVAVYIAEGSAGFPVFASAKCGITALAGHTGGYIVGFFFAAYIVGYLSQLGCDRSFWKAAIAMTAGNIVIYIFGLAWLFVLTQNLKITLAEGLYPFIAGDLIKIVLAAALLPSAWKILNKIRLPK